ncbi:transcriptional regulator [Arthrobacter sp. BB-1]|uniref:AfsR/SARP family transcriptional regulator n=1 Tax=unclassified Arthrobacter TaxID=235627 RepID=UPI00111223B3|nr:MULTISPECIES: BTAD domain-containing putative transcriptional regulator [unclassified Arthrobacter]TNB71967.1 transcriptional regulator [Arthrobacter sp. BB-1]UEL26895.1 transcriptional regulator [Pseudarthrobacter sp. L1SW]
MGDDGYGELKLELLGSWRLWRDGAVVHVATRQQRLIAALAIKGPLLRTYLVGLLWPEYPDSKALESLRVSVHLISRQVPGLIVNEGRMLYLSDDVDVDLRRVRLQARSLGAAALQTNRAALLDGLRDAQLLPGWYEDWIMVEQSRLQQDRLRAYVAIAAHSLALGDTATAEAAAEAAVEIEPLYESAVQLLIQAELQDGNPAAALRAYERYRKQLGDDMGLLPSESVSALLAGALERRPGLRTERSVPPRHPWLSGQPALDHA